MEGFKIFDPRDRDDYDIPARETILEFLDELGYEAQDGTEYGIDTLVHLPGVKGVHTVELETRTNWKNKVEGEPNFTTFPYWDVNMSERKGKYWTTLGAPTADYAVFRPDMKYMGIISDEDIRPYVFDLNVWLLDNRYAEYEPFYKIPYGLFDWYRLDPIVPIQREPRWSKILPPNEFVMKLCENPSLLNRNRRLRYSDNYEAFMDQMLFA
jgi:hypothetical protein